MTDNSSELVLVTGVSGFIAGHVAREALQAGFRVRGTVRSLANKEKISALRQICAEAESEEKFELVEANLTDEACWDKVVDGCTLCCHVASPFPGGYVKNEDDVIVPAVNGTKNVLAACGRKAVKRVVLTSSCYSLYAGRDTADHVFTVDDWADEQNADAYGKSKVLAEKAGWELQKGLADGERFELAAILPSLVQGPALTATVAASTSMDLVANMMNGKVPQIPEVGFGVVDVRDVAYAHVAALTRDGADGKRFILSNETVALRELAVALNKEFTPMGYKIPTKQMGGTLFWVASKFSKDVSQMYSMRGEMPRFDNSVTTEVLEVEWRDIRKATVDAAHSLIKLGVVPRKSGYVDPEEKPADNE